MCAHTERADQGRNVGEKQLELKYCERCGSLWLREQGCGEVYCVKCVPEIEELPPPKKRPQSVRRGKGPRLPNGPRYGLPWNADDIRAEWEFWPTAGEQ